MYVCSWGRPKTDKVRKTYSLLNERWGAMTGSKTVDLVNNVTVISMNVTTENKVLSLQYNIASVAVPLGSHTTATMNPNSTKIDVKISMLFTTTSQLSDVVCSLFCAVFTPPSYSKLSVLG